MREPVTRSGPILYDSPWWSRLRAFSERRAGLGPVGQRQRDIGWSSFSRRLAFLLRAVDGSSVRGIFLKLNNRLLGNIVIYHAKHFSQSGNHP